MKAAALLALLQVSQYQPADLTPYARSADLDTVRGAAARAQAAADAVNADLASGVVRTVNGVAPTSGAVTIPTPTFLAGYAPAAPGLLAGLYSAPSVCDATKSGQYAAVRDLYGQVAEVMRCTSFGAWGYGWRAQRSDFAAVVSTLSSFTVSCNVTPPSINLQGTLTTSMTITFSTAGCTPGQRQEIQNNMALGVNTVTANGLVGTVTSKLLAGASTSVFIYDSAGWRAY